MAHQPGKSPILRYQFIVARVGGQCRGKCLHASGVILDRGGDGGRIRERDLVSGPFHDVGIVGKPFKRQSQLRNVDAEVFQLGDERVAGGDQMGDMLRPGAPSIVVFFGIELMEFGIDAGLDGRSRRR